jgi:hypothetical protein
LDSLFPVKKKVHAKKDRCFFFTEKKHAIYRKQ